MKPPRGTDVKTIDIRELMRMDLTSLEFTVPNDIETRVTSADYFINKKNQIKTWHKDPKYDQPAPGLPAGSGLY